VIGPTGVDVAAALVAPFQQKYGITVELTQLRGADAQDTLRTILAETFGPS
jgi:hypothetical protein